MVEYLGGREERSFFFVFVHFLLDFAFYFSVFRLLFLYLSSFLVSLRFFPSFPVYLIPSFSLSLPSSLPPFSLLSFLSSSLISFISLPSYRGISPTRAIWTPFCVPGGRSSARSPPAHRRLPPKLMARHLGGKPLSVGSPSHRHSASCSHVSAPSSHPTVDDSGSERVQVMRYLGGAGTLPQVWRILGPKVYSCLVSS